MTDAQTSIPEQKRKIAVPILQAITVLFALPAATMSFIAGNIIPGLLMSTAGVLMLAALVGRIVCSKQ